MSENPDIDVDDAGDNGDAGDAGNGRPSLEDSLADVDEATREHILREVRTARSEARNLRERLREAEPVVEQWRSLEEASKTELERAQEAARANADRIGALTQRAVTAEVRALAAGRFADPADAGAFLDLGGYVDETSGEIDSARIASDLDALLKRKPHLAAQRGPRPNPAQGGSAGGARMAPADFMNHQIRVAAGRA